MLAAGANAGLSPLVSSYSEGWSFNRPYGSMLPRPASAFTLGAFGPLNPIQPVGIDPPGDSGRPAPRRFQYPVGWNLPVGQPGSEGIKLTTFATLRAVADMYSVARSCVDKRINEIVGLDWDIVPTKAAEHAMKGDPDLRDDFEARRAVVKEFFAHPDSDRAKFPTFATWLTSLLEDRFVIDAVAIYLHPPRRPGGGPFGSDLASLDLLDGSTIRPLLDLSGATPPPPTVAYQAYEWGVPRVDLTSLLTDSDIEVDDVPVGEYRADQLIYLRETPRNFTPYGFSCVEKALLPISIGLARQQFQYDYFSEGSVPGQWITPGPDIATPAQIRQLQDALNAMAGDIGAKHRIIVLPPGSKADPQKPAPLADQFDEWIVSQVAMPFGLSAMDLGVTPRVSAVQSPSESRMLSQVNTDRGSQTRIEPVISALKADLFDYVIHKVFRQTDMEFSWGLTQVGQSRDDRINQHVTMTKNGLESIDEARVALGNTPWGLPETSVPLVITATGPVPLSTVVAEHTTDVTPPLTTPAHEAVSPKAVTAELDILARHLRKGRPPETFRTQALPHESLTAARLALPKGVDAARLAAHSAWHRARRANRLTAAASGVATVLGTLLHDQKKGKIATLAMVDAGVAALKDGYHRAARAGAGDAVADHDVPPIPDDVLASDAARRAEAQRGFVARLLKDSLTTAVTALAARLALYGATLTGAYEAAYGRAVTTAHPEAEIVWQLGDTEHCPDCTARDGARYTLESLPGWPGDGDFGGPLCEGGPNCGCSLSYQVRAPNTRREDSIPHAAAQRTLITEAREQARANREAFLDTIPGEAAARARSRDIARYSQADAANEAIRDSGGYPGVSVEPADIPAEAT